MDPSTICQAVGRCGFVTCLVGFTGNQMGWLDGNSCAYCISIINGVSLVLVSLSHALAINQIT
ncbi:CBU_0592 family membrane protein [Litoreibacter janthinus]|uniref:Uncharacterized protein n=1 Tax=Litoreibacter janthinus TaxID=670154 RepID=A0A1I6GNU5_9RHOB|nr:hypothetical protein [Litoreibacter janthinus]SFR43864.1 hypothetical protein SAMN04488002_1774 [Litoreibacter janthinus]